VPGGEAGPGGWAGYVTGNAPGQGRHALLGVPFFKFMVFEDPNWDYKTFKFTASDGFDSDIDYTDSKLGALFNAVNPDLSQFKARGGKLIHYHGWSDPDIPPTNSVHYFESVVASVGGNRSGALEDTREFYRLFMVPGMQHCTGGPGTASFDAVAALEQWVEQKHPPEKIVAAHLTNGKADRTRPLCPYPQEAKYKGTGSTDDAANFVCAAP
jgi:feruloyl esterase